MNDNPILRVMREETKTWSKIGFVFLAFLILSPIYQDFTESRFYRDLTLQTPFHSVVVTQADVVPEGLELRGEMVKRRCEFQGLDAYVRRGVLTERVMLDTAPEDGQRPSGNRQSSPYAQLWGPWIIYVPVGRPSPDEWLIYARHFCKSDSWTQQNLFAQGDWPK